MQNNLDNHIEKMLTDFDNQQVQPQQDSKNVSKEQVKEVVGRISKAKDLDESTAYGAVAELFRKGASNAGANANMNIDVTNKDKSKIVEVTRYDIIVALEAITGHKNVRKLAEAMAHEILVANLKKTEKFPSLDLKGDLAKVINKKLALKGQNLLTRKEEICCCTYTQNLPNLNELAGSDRLKSLLEKDLEDRIRRKQKNRVKNNNRNNNNRNTNQ
jgi:hypothetical protein